jgi:hypothetical protein
MSTASREFGRRIAPGITSRMAHRPAGTDGCSTPCMPCSFGLLPHRRSGTGVQPNGRLEVTVTVRSIPLMTAAYGMWVARPARTTILAPGGDGSNSAAGRGPSSGDHCIVGKGQEGSRQQVGRLQPRTEMNTACVLGLLHSSPTTADDLKVRSRRFGKSVVASCAGCGGG